MACAQYKQGISNEQHDTDIDNDAIISEALVQSALEYCKSPDFQRNTIIARKSLELSDGVIHVVR